MFDQKLIELLEVIGVTDKEEIEIVKYGFQHLFLNLLGICSILIIGKIMGMLLEAFAMAVAIFPLRKYAGGMHAKSQQKCYLLSCALVTLGFFTAKWIGSYIFIVFTISVCAVLTILFLAPVDSSNKILDELEKKEYKQKVVQVVCVEVVAVFISQRLDFERVSLGIIISWWIVAVAVLAGKKSSVG